MPPAAEQEIESLIPHCASPKEPACVTLGKWHSPRMPPEEGNGKPLLNTLYLENPEGMEVTTPGCSVEYRLSAQNGHSSQGGFVGCCFSSL